MFSLSYVTQIPLHENEFRKFDNRLEDIHSRKNILLDNLKTKIYSEIQPQLAALESHYRFEVPWQKVLAQLDNIDFKTHVELAHAAMSSQGTAHALLLLVDPNPNMSRQDLAKINVADKALLFLSAGVMLPPRVSPKGAFYFAYVIRRFYTNINLFEEMEKLIPNAGYRTLIPPGTPRSEESKNFFSSPKRCLESLEGFKDGVKKYIVYDRGFRDETAYSVRVKISEILFDLEFWLKWEPKRIEICKHINQGASFPPTKVIDCLEREDELEVMAVRLPIWLKKKLEDEARSRQEQPGTYLRRKLEDFYR